MENLLKTTKLIEGQVQEVSLPTTPKIHHHQVPRCPGSPGNNLNINTVLCIQINYCWVHYFMTTYFNKLGKFIANITKENDFWWYR